MKESRKLAEDSSEQPQQQIDHNLLDSTAQQKILVILLIFRKKFPTKTVDKCITLYLANKYVPACLRMGSPQFSIFKPENSFMNILIYNYYII